MLLSFVFQCIVLPAPYLSQPVFPVSLPLLSVVFGGHLWLCPCWHSNTISWVTKIFLKWCWKIMFQALSRLWHIRLSIVTQDHFIRRIYFSMFSDVDIQRQDFQCIHWLSPSTFLSWSLLVLFYSMCLICSNTLTIFRHSILNLLVLLKYWEQFPFINDIILSFFTTWWTHQLKAGSFCMLCSMAYLATICKSLKLDGFPHNVEPCFYLQKMPQLAIDLLRISLPYTTIFWSSTLRAKSFFIWTSPSVYTHCHWDHAGHKLILQ